MGLLENIDGPADVKALPVEKLDDLAAEVRAAIIETVNRNGGHLASPLGVVELTLALHYVFDLDTDRLVWDVGHQCYAHKLLTGRRERFHTLRTRGGIAGYPRQSESPFDAFGTGHSATSISAAVGLAIARDQRGETNHVIAVIGDGAFSGGLALEAMNHAGHLGLDLLVILNDNEMSIAPNTGALARSFNRMIMAGPYKRAKQDVGSYVKQLIGERITRTIQDLEKSVKGFITKGALFQEFGFNYIGPVDGHDLPLLIGCLNTIKKIKGPVLLHCRTEKGKGLKEAEENPAKYHGVGPRAIKAVRAQDEEGDGLPAAAGTLEKPIPTFTEAFAEAMLEAGEADERVIGITAAMPAGTGMSKFEERFPERFFDVGICEQHAVTLASGMAANGLRPVAAIYSTFLQRAYDQVIHDVCIQNLPVVLAIDRAGLVGEDSPTHGGTFDLTFLRTVPNLVVAAPRDCVDTRLLLHWAVRQTGPCAVRYARGSAPVIGAEEGRDVSRGELLREGGDLVFLAVGPVLAACLEAAERLEDDGISAAVADARFVKPLDGVLLDALSDRPIVTVEENALQGGFGSAILEYFADAGRLDEVRIHRLGLPDRFDEHATRQEQLERHGLDAAGLYASARAFLGSHTRQTTK